MKVRLPSGREIEGESWITTPLDVAKGVNYDVANQALIARVNDQLWDLERPFETDSKLEILKASEPEAQAAFWRSSSFILSEVLERASGGLVYEAAADDDGFHCDIFIEEEPVGELVNDDLSNTSTLKILIITYSYPPIVHFQRSSLYQKDNGSDFIRRISF